MSDSTPQAATRPRVFKELAREIAARITEQRSRLRRVSLGTGIAMSIVVLCGWVVAETLTDFFSNLPWILRLLFLLVGFGGAGTVFWWFALRPWRRKIEDEKIALMIERALPAFRSRFIATVQLAKSFDKAASPSLVKALIVETTAMASR